MTLKIDSHACSCLFVKTKLPLYSLEECAIPDALFEKEIENTKQAHLQFDE